MVSRKGGGVVRQTHCVPIPEELLEVDSKRHDVGARPITVLEASIIKGSIFLVETQYAYPQL